MNDMSSDTPFDMAKKVREALERAHLVHPNSAILAVLHRRLQTMLEAVGPTVLSPDEVTALGGGTPKTDP